MAVLPLRRASVKAAATAAAVASRFGFSPWLLGFALALALGFALGFTRMRTILGRSELLFRLEYPIFCVAANAVFLFKFLFLVFLFIFIPAFNLAAIPFTFTCSLLPLSCGLFVLLGLLVLLLLVLRGGGVVPLLAAFRSPLFLN